MTIEPLMSRSIVSVGPDHVIAEAARRMAERHVGSAVVLTEDGHPGIITERDILRAVAQGVDLEKTAVADYMTSSVITATPSWDVVQAAKCMADGGFRHLTVVDERGSVMGVLSIRDLVAALLEEAR